MDIALHTHDPYKVKPVLKRLARTKSGRKYRIQNVDRDNLDTMNLNQSDHVIVSSHSFIVTRVSRYSHISEKILFKSDMELPRLAILVTNIAPKFSITKVKVSIALANTTFILAIFRKYRFLIICEDRFNVIRAFYLLPLPSGLNSCNQS